MHKPKLNPEALEVSSFATSPEFDVAAAVKTIDDLVATTTDPTAMTRCFICPPRTADCV